MSIFKKIFGHSDMENKTSEIKKPDIDKLLSSDDINNSIIELDDYISALGGLGDNLDLLSDCQKNFYYNQNLEREVNNGGFNQFYFNTSGDFAHETVDSLKAIGAYKTAMIVEKANNQFPDKIVPKNREIRQRILLQIEEKANEVWDELDENFFEYEEDLNTLNMEYIRKNKNEF